MEDEVTQKRLWNPELALDEKQIFKAHCPCARARSLQLCPTLCNPDGLQSTGSSVHGDSPGKSTGAGCHALLQGNSFLLSHQGIPVRHTEIMQIFNDS